MNCKPGDLAVVIRAPKEVQHHIGKIVRCLYLRTSWDGLPCWQLETPFWDTVQGRRGRCEAIADRDLMPIRGDLSDDEAPQSIGKPQCEPA